MAYPVYTIPAGGTLYHLFDTFASSTGAPITMSGFAVGDILVYKNGSTTQRSSTAGFTLLDTDGIDFDSITGIHGFSIDTSDNTDASFYTTGGWFHVVVSAVTVDSQTMSFVACAFRIVAAESSAGVSKVDVTHFGGTAGTFSSGRPEVNTTHAAGTAWGSGAITAASLASDAITAAKVAADVGAEIADAVWDEATSGHTSSGTAGLALRNTDLRGDRVVVRGTVGNATSPSTTQFTPSALSPAGASLDQFKGRIIVFDNDTATAALRGQATNITASSNSSTPLFTFSALSTAPASGDTFSIC